MEFETDNEEADRAMLLEFVGSFQPATR